MENKKKFIRSFLSLFLFVCTVSTQGQTVQRIEPLNWWVEMKNPELQVILYGKNIGECQVKIDVEGVELQRSRSVDNPNYLFLDLKIAPNCKAGSFPIALYRGTEKVETINYQLKARNTEIKAQGVNASDFIYLLMPDRFSNGDTSNDIVQGLLETALNRDSMYYRHGGDLKGVIDKLDYLQDLGITALWMTPVLTNDMPQASYHGYANTENYQIDPRFGNLETYQQLAKELHKREMKLVHDVVPNHVGLNHWTVLDKPFADWVHVWPEFTQTTYKDQTMFDPYGAIQDKELMEKGWFVSTMPDMNQQNELVAKYITQSHIWWIETVGIDGFRIDTYPYNDLKFMATWTDAIRNEFPEFSFFGETWVQSSASQAFFLGGQKVDQQVDTNLEGVTDFQLNYAIGEALNKENGGAERLYSTLGLDFLYPNPLSNVIFLDNHDKDRFFSVVGEDIEKYKSAMSWLLTSRGIPQIYYGAEVLMKNFSAPDGKVRDDFKGGFPNDKVNKFSDKGRSEQENEMFNHIRTLAQYRKSNPVLQTGKTKHYVPQQDVYVYFRYTEDAKVMVLMNCSTQEQDIRLNRFSNMIGDSIRMRNIQEKDTQKVPNSISIKPKQTLVFELK
ncbi:glycoside hydrolase family 13 protein [Sphingobacterium shayense]|uniref:glycoside hydrolase family 13 protein n=1 Tax=Sphingobacterium shayense TaxID=626343 RepID=UPI001555BE76|nr:glycoside hydrolase family 13 protein [Sphingobacterium shayense]NQD70801.1 glycoside hydrolase family 13 protein [Sphingobacterium shayense]